jgi:MASE9
MKLKGSALMFVGAVAAGGCLIVANAIRYQQPMHYAQFVVIFALSLIASRLKVKLPGLNGNMSVNLPFILIAAVQLSLFETLVIALASTAVQCFPKDGGRPRAVQMLFNVSTMAVAVGLAGLIFQGRMPLPTAWVSGSLLLPLAAASFFVAQTIPVAAIISLTEGGSVPRIWSSIFHLSFPYYVLSAGVTSIVTTASHRIGWQIPLLVLPAMYAVYRSYRLYFHKAVAAPPSMALAKSASC